MKVFEYGEVMCEKFLEIVKEVGVLEEGYVFGFIYLGVYGYWSYIGL